MPKLAFNLMDSSMNIDWTPLADLIETHDRFLVTTHVRPDGDALGSEVGMAGFLRQRGKDVLVVNASPTPPRYDFLDPTGTLFRQIGATIQAEALADREVAIILDLSTWNQLGEMAGPIQAFSGPRVVIDHHVSQDDLGAIFLKDSGAEATGMLVAQAIRALGGTCSADVASGLLTAIAMDTGWFRHSNTQPRTLRIVAELIESGAEINMIYRNLFERNTLGRLRLLGETLVDLHLGFDGRVAYAMITLENMARAGAIPPDTEDLIDYVVSVKGVSVGLLFIEQAKGGVKVSFRSRNGLDCSRLAGSLGGGGHRAAAGASLKESMSESVPLVLEAVRKALEPQS